MADCFISELKHNPSTLTIVWASIQPNISQPQKRNW